MGASSQCHATTSSPPDPQKRVLIPIVCRTLDGSQGWSGCMGRREYVLPPLGSEAGTFQPVAVSVVPTILSRHPDVDWKAILTWILRIFLR